MNNDHHTIIQSETGLSTFFAKIYALVGIGIALSALIAGLMLTVFQENMIAIMMNASWLLWGAMILEIVLVFVASGAAIRNSPLALPIFLIYSALNGFTISFIVSVYTQGTVAKAFLSAAAMFFVMAVIGRVTKKDLSGMSKALMAGLIGIIIASVINMFLASSGLDFLISIIAVIVFAGLIAWDNQKIKQIYYRSNGQVNDGWAISMALSLYLDFINLFLNLLRIFGSND